MNPEQTELYNFLGELCQAFKDNDEGLLASHIMVAGFDYIKASYTDKPMTSKQLAQSIAKKHKAFKDEHEAWVAELDARCPTM